MLRRSLSVLFCVSVLASCAPPDSPAPSLGKRLDSPRPNHAPVPETRTSKAAPAEGDSDRLPGKEAPPAHDYQAVAPSPLVTTGHMKTEIPAYQVPEQAREKIEKIDPSLLPAKVSSYSVQNQHLTIDVKEKTVTFSGVLKIKDKADENIELACQFDPNDVPWVCSDMVPTDKKIAAERRLQATFKCLDTNVCNKVGVKLWVVVNGQLQEPQLFQAEGFHIRRADSGDLDESEGAAPDSEVELSPGAQENPPAASSELPPKDESRVSPDQPDSSQTPPEAGNSDKIQDRVPSQPESEKEKSPNEPAAPPVVKNPPAEPPAETKEPEIPLTPAPQVHAGEKQDQEIPIENLDQALSDPNITVEITGPMKMPNPTVGRYSVPGIEKLTTNIGKGVPDQAIGTHNTGYLRMAAEFPPRGPGFISRDHSRGKDFGTDLTVDLLEKAFAQTDLHYPGRPPFVLASVANRTGGKLVNLSGGEHASHRTGLDADVGFPSKRSTGDLWPACTAHGVCVSSKISSQLDDERFWYFLKEMSCAQNHPVMVMFLDQKIKNHMCEYAESMGENLRDESSCGFRALQALRQWPGHFNHVHIRLHCPGNRDCDEHNIILPRATGCPSPIPVS